MFTPYYRPRRLRKNPVIRDMIRETTLSPKDFILPLFITEGTSVRNPITSMPGNYQFSIDQLPKEIKEIKSLDIPAVILFGIPAQKDAVGSEAYNDDGIIQRAIHAIKEIDPDIYIITDECFCEYTDHGHCGIIKENEVDNDATLEILAKQVISHAKAGVDMVAPSGMMDGMVGAIREALDENGFSEIPILSYAVKYASAFYGPFRDAVESVPQFGDRKTYQMDPANWREALKEAAIDVDEGADILMVKPALPYLDILRLVRDQFDLPIAAYNVSGEYAMIKAAGERGWIDEEKVMMETLISIKRAGADLILTYFAKDAAKLLH